MLEEKKSFYDKSFCQRGTQLICKLKIYVQGHLIILSLSLTVLHVLNKLKSFYNLLEPQTVGKDKAKLFLPCLFHIYFTKMLLPFGS